MCKMSHAPDVAVYRYAVHAQRRPAHKRPRAHTSRNNSYNSNAQADPPVQPYKASRPSIAANGNEQRYAAPLYIRMSAPGTRADSIQPYPSIQQSRPCGLYRQRTQRRGQHYRQRRHRQHQSAAVQSRRQRTPPIAACTVAFGIYAIAQNTRSRSVRHVRAVLSHTPSARIASPAAIMASAPTPACASSVGSTCAPTSANSAISAAIRPWRTWTPAAQPRPTFCAAAPPPSP